MLWRGVACAILLVALCACDQSNDESDGKKSKTSAVAPTSRFESDVIPILRQNCATCHLTGQEAGSMSLTPKVAWQTLVNVKAAGAPGLVRVVPGRPEASYLLMKLEGTQIEHGGAGARMPFGAPPLPPDQISIIRQWIADGAEK
ncbi:MAG: hypothetical protein EPO08_08540 [Rhodospirillaceae bacterium]|nr:MAG: hypothetical protein EPO08_08540 [Rhodospirillaceae bacterium]